MAFYDEKTETLIIKWNVEDVQSVRPDLNNEQANDVLYVLAENFDANIGVDWDVITMAAEQLFPEDS
ncbi:MAG: hypothetical protein ACPHDJ_06110 [Candidatus Puniceispirillaceae bacterium]